MAEIISNNILLIQSIVGSLIVFLIVTLFRIYFKKTYLYYFSLSWGFLLSSNVFYLSYIINHIENIYMTDSSYELVYDTGAGVPYIYKKDGTEFISFDNPQSILEKGNYILKNKLGGMMFWEYGTDPTNRLLEAVKQGMGK